jgi:hypothetical protein
MAINEINDSFSVKEIYPHILVYNNLFKDLDRIFSIIKNFQADEDHSVFFNWEGWGYNDPKLNRPGFGSYIHTNNNSLKCNYNLKSLSINELTPKNKIQEDHIYLFKELINAFHIVNNDYMDRFNVGIDTEEMTLDIEENKIPSWRWTGPTICKYHTDLKEVGQTNAMNYHSDYIREPIISPGYKFVLTTTTYFNDDYEGGELDFAIGNKLIKYKPIAGDFVVFPSGHPDFLTKDDNVYLHGVKTTSGKNNKYFSRLYWQKYEKGSDEWFENEKKFGKQNWIDMQKDIMVEYYKENKQRSVIENAERII